MGSILIIKDNRVSRLAGIDDDKKDEQIKSLQHLQDLWTASCAQVAQSVDDETMNIEGGSGDDSNDQKEQELSFVRLELENDDDIVFEVGAAMKAQKEVMATHAIPKPYNILPPNPNYI